MKTYSKISHMKKIKTY